MPILALAVAATVLSFVIAGVAAFVAFVLACAAIAAVAYGLYCLISYLNEQAERERAEHERKEALANTTLLLQDQAKREFLSRKQFLVWFTTALAKLIQDEKIIVPSEAMFQYFVSIADNLYHPPAEIAVPQLTYHGESDYWAEAIANQPAYDPYKAGEAILRCIHAFLKHLPKDQDGQFMVKAGDLLPRKTISEMMTPLFNAGYWGDITQHYVGRCIAAAKGSKYERTPPEYYKEKNAYKHYLPSPLKELFEFEVPFKMFFDTRHAHHWIVGRNRSGKTTYLSNQINYDLPLVAKDECSIIVIDSTVRLAKYIARLKLFAPGQPLHDRLIYIGPDPKYRIALNPFRLGNKQESVKILSYAFSSIFNATDFQIDAAEYVIEAVLQHDNPNLDIFMKFFEDDYATRFAKEIARLRGPAKAYMLHGFPKLHAATRSGMYQRLFGLRKVEAVDAMLNAKECRFDLYEELKGGGKVILIDCDESELGDEKELYGRLFLGMLHRVSQRRTPFDEHTLHRVFAYVDEAQDYIKNDRRVRDMLFQARKRRIGLTLATQTRGQIEDPSVKDALNQAEIHSDCITRGHVQLRMGDERRPDFDLNLVIPNFSFQDQDPMSETEYTAMRERIFEKYGAKEEPRRPPQERQGRVTTER